MERSTRWGLGIFNVAIGSFVGIASLLLTLVMAGVSVHLVDAVPSLLLTVACGLIAYVGVLLLTTEGQGREVAAFAGVAAACGIAAALWRHLAVRPSEGEWLLLALLLAAIVMIGLAEAAYLGRSLTTRASGD
jgi:hypothetical protein